MPNVQPLSPIPPAVPEAGESNPSERAEPKARVVTVRDKQEATAPVQPAAAPSPPVPSQPLPRAGDKLDAQALAGVIDSEIQKQLDAAGVKPAPLADDAEFVRRAYLDLHGVIPTAAEAAAFLDSQDPQKRRKLIDDLLAAPRYGRHFGDIWTRLLLANPAMRSFPEEPLTRWLEAGFNSNKPWNQLTHDLLTATGKVEENGASRFFVHNGITQLSITDLTDTISSVFLGANLKCAQCHDHFFAKWTKADYWGIAGFFTNVSYAYKDKGLFDDGKPNYNRGKFIDSEAKGRLTPAKFLLAAVPPAKSETTGRKAFADWLAAPDNPYLARAAVNRMWAHFFGRGLVNPVDDLRPDKPASHPELFNAVRAQFVASDFDVKFLLRAIVNTQTYQRTSQRRPGEEPDPQQFSHMAVKVLQPEQLYDSLVAVMGGAPNGTGPGDPRDRFADFFKTGIEDPTVYARGVPHVLRLMNSPEFRQHQARLLGEIAPAGRPPAQVIEQLYLTVISRRPTGPERERMLAFVQKQGNTPTAFGQVLWVLLNSSEFVLNR